MKSAILITALICLPPVLNAHGPGHHHARHCRDCADGCSGCSDRGRLRSISGTIAELDYLPSEIVEARLQTPDGPRRVRLATATFLRNRDFILNEGDAIDVTAYRIAARNPDLFVATEIWRGDKRLTLRDRQGSRRW